jgi:hypothetical protein
MRNPNNAATRAAFVRLQRAHAALFYLSHYGDRAALVLELVLAERAYAALVRRGA